jgi:hypothetical protein
MVYRMGVNSNVWEDKGSGKTKAISLERISYDK